MEKILQILLILLIVSFILIIEYICHDVTKDLHNNVHHDTNKHLIYISHILTQNKIKHWLMCGTLLGAAINNKIIESDPDIDIGLLYDDYDKVNSLTSLFLHNGYVLERNVANMISMDKLDNKINWTGGVYIYHNKVQIAELIFYTQFTDGISRRYDNDSNSEYFPSMFTIPSYFIDELVNIEINNKIYKAPRDYNTLLTYWYGNNWFKIKPEEYSTFSELDNGSRHYNRYLSFLTNHVAQRYIVIPKSAANYTYPNNQIEWIKNNEL